MQLSVYKFKYLFLWFSILNAKTEIDIVQTKLGPRPSSLHLRECLKQENLEYYWVEFLIINFDEKLLTQS